MSQSFQIGHPCMHAALGEREREREGHMSPDVMTIPSCPLMHRSTSLGDDGQWREKRSLTSTYVQMYNIWDDGSIRILEYS